MPSYTCIEKEANAYMITSLQIVFQKLSYNNSYKSIFTTQAFKLLL